MDYSLSSSKRFMMNLNNTALNDFKSDDDEWILVDVYHEHD